MTTLQALIRLLRPSHWVKNVFVLAGLFFSGKFLEVEFITGAGIAFAVFCLASSSIYALNDVLDRHADAQHPRKRLRPVAAGLVSPSQAYALSLLCGAGALGLALVQGPRLALLAALYLAINVAYARKLKHVVLLDVFSIASGFLLRLLAGTSGIGIPPSQWFVLCTFLLSLFLGFSKRYAERMDDTQDPDSKRSVVEDYSPDFLRMLLGVTLACTLMSYGMYTMSAHTVSLHNTERLIYTLPFAAYVLFRYLWLVTRRGFGENLAGELFRDRGLVAGVLAYILSAGLLLRGPS